MLRVEDPGCGPKPARFSMRRSAGIGVSSSCWPRRRPGPCGSPPPIFCARRARCTSWWRCPARGPRTWWRRSRPSGLLIEATVPPPAFEAGVEVVRLEIPYGRMRRRIDLPAGSYTLLEHRARSRLSVSAPDGDTPMSTEEKHAGRHLPCPKMCSSSCRCAIWCCSRAWCCRSRSAASARSPRRRKPCARSAASDWSCRPRRATILRLKQLHRVGTVASIVRFITAADGTHHLIAQGEERFTVLDYVSREPFLVARIEPHKEATVIDPRDRSARAHLARAGDRGAAAPAAGARRSSPTPFAASSRFPRSPTSWRASWT